MKHNLFGLLAAGAAFFGCGYAFSQATQPSPVTLETQITDLDAELRGFGDAAPDAVGVAGASIARTTAGNATLTDIAIKQAYSAARTNRGQFNDLKLRSLQIAQNQRMIELLEKLNESKKQQ